MAHAVTDALLGAIGQPDIGEIFPDTDPQWEGADSMQFVEKASRMVAESGRRVVNLDITVICDKDEQRMRDAVRDSGMASLRLGYVC